MKIFRFGKKNKITVNMPLEAVKKNEHENAYPSRIYPIQFLSVLDDLSLVSPDLSQALNRSVQLANTGHSVEVIGGQESAQKFLENYSKNMFAEGAGADSLVNAMLRQITLKGALSVEMVPNETLDDVETVRLVPVESVRFKYIDGKREMVQGFLGEEHVLNPHQYIYFPLAVDERSPYGIPPFITALDALTNIQPASIQSIKKILNKFGLLGFINAKRNPPAQLPEESLNEYQARLSADLRRFVEVSSKSFENGATASYADTTIEHHTLTDNTRGAIDLFREVEQQVASGLDIDPALLGRSYSTTETYAGVVYHAFLAGNQNKRRLVKRALERIFEFKLLLNGHNVERVKVTFNPDPVLKPEMQSMVETSRVDNVIKKLQAGLIDADLAAQELGYEKATGERWIPQNGQFRVENGKPAKGVYSHFAGVSAVYGHDIEKDRINANATQCNGLEAIEEHGLKEQMCLEFEKRIGRPLTDTERKFVDFFRRLGKNSDEQKFVCEHRMPLDLTATAVGLGQKKKPIDEKVAQAKQASDLYDASLLKFREVYANELKDVMREVEEVLLKKPTLESVMRVVDNGLRDRLPIQVYSVLRPYFIDAWNGGVTWARNKSEMDKAIEFTQKSGQTALPKLENQLKHNFGKSYGDQRANLQEIVRKELAGIASDPQPGMRIAAEVAANMGKSFSKAQLFNAYRIAVGGAVMRHRNFSQVLQMEHVGYKYVEIVAVMDNKTSMICQTMNGRRVPIGVSADYVRGYIAADPKEALKKFNYVAPQILQGKIIRLWADEKDFTPENLSGKNSGQILAGMNTKLPPYHANCRTTVVPGVEERVVNVRGRKLKKFDDSLVQNKYRETAKQITKEFSSDEISSKVNHLMKSAKWDEKNLQKHFDDHIDVRRFLMKDLGLEMLSHVTIEHYRELSLSILKQFDYLYVYKVDGDNRVLFYDRERELVSVASLSNGNMVSCHRLRPDKKKTLNRTFLRIL